VIRPRIVATLFRKDMVDGIRESRVLISLLTPIILALLYNVLFPDERVVQVKAVYVGPETSAIVQTLKTRAESGQSVDLKLTRVATKEEAVALVRKKDVDVAFVMPDDIDEAIKAGRAPTVTLIQPDVSTSASSFVENSIAIGARTLADQRPPAVIAIEPVKAGGTDTGALLAMGTRRYFVLATVVMMLGMVAILAVPIMLTEEVEKKTLDALLIVGSYLEVIAAKALVGLTYTALAVALMLFLTRLRPADLPTFAVGTAMLSLSLIGIGLLIGGLFRNAQQVYSWSSVLLIPVIGPAFAVGLPVPDALDLVLRLLPTSQGMKVMANGLAGKAVFTDLTQSYIVVIVWAAAAYGILAWRLSRRES